MYKIHRQFFEEEDRETFAKCIGCGEDHLVNFKDFSRQKEYLKSFGITVTLNSVDSIEHPNSPFPTLKLTKSAFEKNICTSTADLRKMLTVLQKIRVLSKMEIALMMVEYLDGLL